MFKRLRKFFAGPTVEEQFARGRELVDTYMADYGRLGHTPAQIADHLYAMGFGCFNDTAVDRAFDNGIQDRLHELGFDSPY